MPPNNERYPLPRTTNTPRKGLLSGLFSKKNTENSGEKVSERGKPTMEDIKKEIEKL